VIVRPLPAELVDRYGLGIVVSTLAQWLSFQASIWHEIATWYGWESVAGFSERASAFSPEDLYSNMLGSKLMLAINAQRQGLSEPQFNRGVDGWFGRALELLGAVPADLGRDVTRAVDGLWWDSRRRVPDPGLVQRRNFDIGDPIGPWLAPESTLSDDLRVALEKACPGERSPVVFANPTHVRGIALADYATLEIEVDDSLAEQEPFASRGRHVTQADFPELVSRIVEQARAEFGPRADRPD
jgi:predicted transcriptional regulator